MALETKDPIYVISSDDLYLMAQGNWYRSYDKLGAHPLLKMGRMATILRYGAPTLFPSPSSENSTIGILTPTTSMRRRPVEFGPALSQEYIRISAINTRSSRSKGQSSSIKRTRMPSMRSAHLTPPR